MKLKIDMQNPAHVKAAAAFFNSLAERKPYEKAIAAELVPEKPVAEKPVKEKPVADKPVAEKPVAEKPEESEVTREDLILLVSELSSNADNKNAMRLELDKLGAKNTRSLTTDQYKAFYDFLVNLKAQ